jgi:hypothetical protein
MSTIEIDVIEMYRKDGMDEIEIAKSVGISVLLVHEILAAHELGELSYDLDRSYDLNDDDSDDDDAFTKDDHYDNVGYRLGIHSTVWSMSEVDDLDSPHPYRGAQTLVYNAHWGEKPVYVPIVGTTWADLWVAADAAIKQSGDNHHVFIEGFEQASEDLYLHTGS